MESTLQSNTSLAASEKWIRLPSKGHCPFTGLTRSHFYQLMKDGKIKSANLKKPGCLTGVRVIWLPSVLEYIEKHVEEQGVSDVC